MQRFITIAISELLLQLASAGDIYGTAITNLPEYCYNQIYTDADIERYVYANYSPLARPVLNASQPVPVSFTIIFERIVDIFEKEQILLVDAYLIVEWKNELINWQDVAPINCSKKLIAPANKVWLPDILIGNSPSEKYSLLLMRGHKVEVTYDGMCDYYPSGIFNATCSLNLRYFPYDKQICKLRFAPWSYSSEMQQLFASDYPIDFDHFEQHEQWELESQEAINVKTTNPTDMKTYDEVQIVLHLRRKPGFFLITLVVPVMIISIVEMSIFGLPTTNGNKIYILFTALLAFGFFQLMMLEDIPRDGGASLPLLSIYLDLTMGYIGLVLIGESILFLVIRRASTDKPPPPAWLLKPFASVADVIGIECSTDTQELMLSGRVANRKTAKADLAASSIRLFPTPGNSVENETDRSRRSTVQHLMPLLRQFRRFEDDLKAKKKQNRNRDERHHFRYGNKLYQYSWLLIAQVLERAIFAIYVAVLILTPIVFFVMLPPLEPPVRVLEG